MRKISTFFRNLSINWKFIFAYYAVLIIPLAFFGIYFYSKASENSISQAKLVMERNLMQTRASIIQKVTLIQNALQIITTDDKVKSIFYYEYEDENYRLRDFQFDVSPMLQNIYRQNNLIYAIRIYTPNAIFTEMVGSYYSIRKKDSPEWFEKVAKAMPSVKGWSPTHQSMGNALRTEIEAPEEVLSYCGAIVSPVSAAEVNIGLAEIETKESLIFDMLRDPVISKWGKTFVVNEDGVIVSNNIPELYKKSISSMGIRNFIWEAAINSVDTIENEKSILIAIPVDELNCSIVGIFPVENFTREARGSSAELLAVLFISSIILGVIIYIITNMLLRRVKRLVKAMNQVKDNNLDVSVPVTSMDEFGELTLNFNHMTRRIHELVETVYKIKLIEREAELKALEAQINPHFLYNTLATISWVARKGSPGEVVKISNSLAKFYRLVLSKGGTVISVRDEIDMVRAYLSIQKIRFGDMFDVKYVLDDNALNCSIVKNMLQPLVENALNHGIEPKRAHGLIIIRAELRDECIILQVLDDGVGMNKRTVSDILEKKVERSSGGYAVKNIIERLSAFYGDCHTFEIFSRPGIGSQFVITITGGKNICLKC